MKKNLLLLIGMALFITVSCKKPIENNSNEEAYEAEALGKQQSSEAANSDIMIDLRVVKQRIENYKNAHPNVVGDEYALRSWVSLKELKEYIAHIEKVSQEKGITVSGIDLIHVQNLNAQAGLPNVNNQDYDLTLLMAPTYEQDSKQIAFDPIYSEKGAPKALEELLDTIDLSNRSQKAKPSSVANHITSCPNNCY